MHHATLVSGNTAKARIANDLPVRKKKAHKKTPNKNNKMITMNSINKKNALYSAQAKPAHP